jgi:hypothetical protein
MTHGGIVVAHQTVLQSGLIKAIDSKLELLKVHRPYHESDHVLNIAYNALCGGHCLDDIEFRRNDEAYLDALGVQAIPDPTTAGDFCRRFDASAVESLMDIVNKTRIKVWKRQSQEFFETARIDTDGTLLSTSGECKEGMALSYKGTWGYHPLLVSLANTAEPLFIVNRSGNRGSQHGAAPYMDKAISLCREAGFESVLLRGDTAFSLTANFDRWTADGVRFVFGYRNLKNIKDRADGLQDDEYVELVRKADKAFAEKPRAKQPRHKEAYIAAKRYKNIRLLSEDVAEFNYRPTTTKGTYRMVVLRKNLSVQHGQQSLLDTRYFFYVTNDREFSGVEVVRESNLRCDQEKLIDQLKNGVRALRAPVNTFDANWAYMVMSSLAWTIKAWMALLLPISPRWRERHLVEQRNWLRMGFRSFVEQQLHIPPQVVVTGRKLVVRLLAWKPQQLTLFRLYDTL